MDVEQGPGEPLPSPPEPEELHRNIDLYRGTKTYEEFLPLLTELIRTSDRVREPILGDETFWAERIAAFFPELALLIEGSRNRKLTVTFPRDLQKQIMLLTHTKKPHPGADYLNSYAEVCLQILSQVRNDADIADSVYLSMFFSEKVTDRCAEDVVYAHQIARLFRATLPLAIPHHSFYFSEHAMVLWFFYRLLAKFGYLFRKGSPYSHVLMNGLFEITPGWHNRLSFFREEAEEKFLSVEENREPILDMVRLVSFFKSLERELLQPVTSMEDVLPWLREYGLGLMRTIVELREFIHEAEEINLEGMSDERYRSHIERGDFEGDLRNFLWECHGEWEGLSVDTPSRGMVPLIREALTTKQQLHSLDMDRYVSTPALFVPIDTEYPKFSLALHVLTLCDMNPATLQRQREIRCHEALIHYFQPSLARLMKDFRGFVLYQFTVNEGEIPPPDYPEYAVYIDENGLSTGLNRLSYAIWRRSGLYEQLVQLDLDQPLLCDALTNCSFAALELMAADSLPQEMVGDGALVAFLRLVKQTIAVSGNALGEDLLNLMGLFNLSLREAKPYGGKEEKERANKLIDLWSRSYPYTGNSTVIALYVNLTLALQDSGVPLGLEGVLWMEEEGDVSKKRGREEKERRVIVTESMLGTTWQGTVVMEILLQNFLSQYDPAETAELFRMVKSLLTVAKFTPDQMRLLFSNERSESGRFWMRCIERIGLTYRTLDRIEVTKLALEATLTFLRLRPEVKVSRNPTPPNTMIVDSDVTLRGEPNGTLVETSVTMTKEETVTTEVFIENQWQLVLQDPPIFLVKLNQQAVPQRLEDLNFPELFNLARFKWHKNGVQLVDIVKITLWKAFRLLRSEPGLVLDEPVFLRLIGVIAEVVLYRYLVRTMLPLMVGAQEEGSLGARRNGLYVYYIALKEVFMGAYTERDIRLYLKTNFPLHYLVGPDFLDSLFEAIKRSVQADIFEWVFTTTDPDDVLDSLMKLLNDEVDGLFRGPSSLGFEDPSQVNFMYKIYTYLVVNRYYQRIGQELGRQAIHIPHPWQSVL